MWGNPLENKIDFELERSADPWMVPAHVHL